MTHTSSASMLSFFISKKFLFVSFLCTLGFLLLSILLYEFTTIANILFLPYGLVVKTKVLIFTFWGFFHASSQLNTVTQLSISVLFGINLSLLILKSQLLRVSRAKKRVIFGAGALSIISAGCAACGLSVFSVVGLGGTLAALPFKGYEASIISLALLIVSLYFNIRSYTATCSLK